MCEMMKMEPKVEDMPVERSDLYPEVQEVFGLYDYLPANWEGFSGTYMGKDLSILPILFNEFKTSQPIRRLSFMLIPIIDNYVAEDIKRQQEAKGSAIKGDGIGGR